MTNKSKCLVVLSGGQDSTICAFWAKKYFDEVHCVTFNYNQKHSREIECARQIAKLIGAASHEIVDVGPILAGRSPLTNPDENLELYENFEQMDKVIGDRVELTFVPMRNALFLTLAANRAICKDITVLVTGVCQADNANYPDCREDFIMAQEQAITLALGLDKTANRCFAIATPLMPLSKAEGIDFLMSLNTTAFASMAFTHTAYDGAYPPVGRDHASTLRAHGFEMAGVPDPLVVRAWSEGLMSLPGTSNYQDQEQIDNLVVTINALKARLISEV